MGKARIAVVVCALALAVYATLHAVPTTFNVSLVTERLEFTTGLYPTSPLPFRNARVLIDDGTEPRSLSGSITLASRVKVALTRTALGPLIVHAEALDSGVSVGELRSEADEPVTKLRRTAEIVIENIKARAEIGESVMFPFTGYVNSGRVLGVATTPDAAVLRSGKVSMLSRSIAGGGVFQAGEASLDPGDRLVINGAEAIALGFVVADERPALTAAYRVIGDAAQIVRPGGQSYDISNSLRNRIVKDEALQLLWVTFIAIAGLMRYLPELKKISKGVRRVGRALALRSLIALGVAMTSSLAIAPDLFAEQVFVRGVEDGRGLLRIRGRSCYVITPQHVVGDNAPVTVIGDRQRTSAAARQRTALGDIAILSVVDASGMQCDELPSTRDIDKTLNTAITGALRLREEDGTLSQFPVNILNTDSVDFITIQPVNARDRLTQTMSGALLFVGSQAVGMLQAVEAGKGMVYRMDAIEQVTRRFFSAGVVGASLRVVPVPDTIAMSSGSFQVVAMNFTETAGQEVRITMQNAQFFTDDAKPLGKACNECRILGGGFSVPGKGTYEFRDNMYLPPEIVLEARSHGTSIVNLRTTYIGEDAEQRRVTATSILKIVVR